MKARWIGENIASWDDDAKPGDVGTGAENYHHNVLVACPCCGRLHVIDPGRWGWNRGTLTLTPSVKVTMPQRGDKRDIICHWNLTNGEFIIHGDSQRGGETMPNPLTRDRLSSTNTCKKFGHSIGLSGEEICPDCGGFFRFGHPVIQSQPGSAALRLLDDLVENGAMFQAQLAAGIKAILELTKEPQAVKCQHQEKIAYDDANRPYCAQDQREENCECPCEVCQEMTRFLRVKVLLLGPTTSEIEVSDSAGETKTLWVDTQALIDLDGFWERKQRASEMSILETIEAAMNDKCSITGCWNRWVVVGRTDPAAKLSPTMGLCREHLDSGWLPYMLEPKTRESV